MALTLFHYIVNPAIFFIAYRLFLGPIISYDFKSVFIGSFFILNYIQALNVYENYNGSFNFLFMCWVVPYLFLFAFILTRFVGQHLGASSSFKTVTFSGLDEIVYKIRHIMTFCILFVTFLYLMDKGFDNINLLYILSGEVDPKYSQHLRVDGLNSNISPILTAVYGYTRALFIPLIMGFYTYLLHNKRISLFYYCFVLLFAAFYSLLNGAKAPVAYMILTCLITYSVINDKFTFKKQFALLFIALFIPSLAYPLISGSQGVEIIIDALDNLWRRVTWVNSYVASLYVNFFEGKPIGFASYNLVASVFDIDYLPVSAYLYDQTTPASATPGGTIDGSFFASFYAENSWMGFIIGTGLTATLLSIIEMYLFTRRMDGVGVTVLSFCLIGSAQLMMTGLNNIILGRGLLLVPIVLFVVDFILKKTKGT